MSLLNNNRLISKISIWVVNIVMALIVLIAIAHAFTVIRFYKPLEQIEHANGMKSWSTSVSLEVFEYKLTKSLECEQTEEFLCQTNLYLSLKKPKVSRMKENLNAGPFKIRNLTNDDVTAEINDSPSPVSLKFNDQRDHTFIITSYVVVSYVMLAVLFTWFWFLRRIIANIAAGQFFVNQNVRYFLWLSVPLIILPFIELIIERVSRSYFIDNFQVMNGGLIEVHDFDVWPVIFGLIFMIMAGVIKEGMKMKEEQDLTI